MTGDQSGEASCRLMMAWPEAPRDFAPLFALERARLGELLRSLDALDWERPTPCPGWSVLGLAAHLVGDDFSFLAWQRDDHRGTPAPVGIDEPGFIDWIDDLQIEWVHAARRLSSQLTVDLLAWTGAQIAEVMRSQDAMALTANVSWASTEPVPLWLDQARELSEYWIHRQQILEAVGRPSDLRSDLVGPVLDGLRWAYPFRLGAVRRPRGSAIGIVVTGPEVQLRWQLLSDGQTWHFANPTDREPIAELAMSTEQAWRLLTNNLAADFHRDIAVSGDSEIGATLLRTRAIIGTPNYRA